MRSSSKTSTDHILFATVFLARRNEGYRSHRSLGALIIGILCSMQCATGAEPEVNLVPWPQSLSISGGEMELTDSSRVVYSDDSLASLAKVVAGEVSEVTRLELNSAKGKPSEGDIYLKLTTNPSITGEEHRVRVDGVATAEAENYNSLAMASVTLIQSINEKSGSYSIPNLEIADVPDAGYRGLMVDVARQPHTIKTLKEMVDMCRLYKIRFFQIHLTDDQAFTFPSKAFPKLTESSAFSFSLEELKNLVAYADERGVTIIPEIDTPAHSTSFTRSMPELFASSGGGVVNFADPEVWQAMDTLINEVCDVFESAPYIHLGADEANLHGMDRDPQFIAAIKRHQAGDIHGLFNCYISHLATTIKARGKKTIAWEGFDYGKTGNAKMDTNVAVMMFDNAKSPQAYIDAGYKVINASWNPMYVVGFDGLGRGVYPDKIFQWDRFQFHGFLNYPMTAKRPALKPLVKPTPDVIGAQMCSWEMLDEREIPRVRFRIAPYADRIWNPTNQNSFAHFEKRYAATDRLLDYMLAEHRPPKPPTNVGASDSFYDKKIRIGWGDGGNYPRKYALYKSTENNPLRAKLVSDGFSNVTTAYEDTAVESGKDYYYWVKARNKWGWSGYSEAVVGRTGTSLLAHAYEPFEYPESANVQGLNGGTGFSTAWDHQSSTGPITIVPESLSYPGIPTKGGALKIDHQKDVAATLNRTLDQELGRDMSDVWMSFLVRGEKVAYGWLTSQLNNSRVFGKESVNGIGIHYHTTVFMEEDVTYLFLLHVDCRPGNDKMHLWVNPAIDKQPSTKGADSYWEVDDIGSGNRLQFNLSGTGEGKYLLDEIRIGTTWEEAIGLSQLDAKASKPFPKTP